MNNSFIFQPNISNQNDENQNKLIFRSLEDNENMKLNTLSGIENVLKNNKKSKFDITFNIIESENYYKIYIEYNNDLYDSIMIKHILDSYIEVMKNINNLENNNIKNIEYMPLKERERIMYSFNNNVCEYTNDKLYHVEFMKIAKKYLNNDAIVNNNVKISYKKLNEMSNSIGNYLRNKGVKRNDIIPIISERSYYFVVGILGIMKSGASYLPIDPDFPKERIDYMIKEANTKLILEFISDEENKKKLKSINIPIYSLKNHDYQLNTEDVININKGDDICYVLFTSGTTGKPKGTLISHFNLINYCLYSQTFNGKGDLYENELGNVLSICKFSHDISIGEINYPLLLGNKIILSNDEEFNNPKLLSSLIMKYDINFIFAVPSRIKVYLYDEEFLNSIKNVKWILLGGEKVDLEIVSTIQNNSTYTNVLSVYGPTETSVVSNIKILDKNICKNKMFNPQITVGKPLCNFKMYILDKYMKPVPVGVVGEIYIGGYGVGKGYLNRPELTNEKFLDCPYYKINGNNGKMYRTGDLGKWTEEGEIVCCGRIDFQVKIRGQRIELNEIENCIKEMKEIKSAIVLDKVKSNGDKYLICYYILDDTINNNNILNENENLVTNKKIFNGGIIKSYLISKLPSYMVPNYYKQINEIPITFNGKLDRKGLPEPKEEDFITETYVAPVNNIEKVICKIYDDIFNIPGVKIGRMHDFYDLGGDSLNAIRISSRIEKELKIKIYINDIMSHSKICDLNEYIESIIKNDKNESNKMEIISKHNCKEFPITSQQLGVYIDTIKEDNNILYNIPSVYKLKENVDKERIKKAFLKIFDEQEILRSKYYGKEINGKMEIYGYIDDECTLKFEEYSYENVNRFIRPFELDKAPLIRVGFIKNEVLLIDMHHIICDGATNIIIMNELNKYYNEEE
eukprot:jgi/Orpsp1_1/1179962/evm.model.c7180000071593.1